MNFPAPTLLAVTSGGQYQKPVQTCSLEDHPTGADIWWLVIVAHTVGERMVRILLEYFFLSRVYLHIY